ncbi:MAG: dienelactone hydrolase family protein, partial [Planctomycetia bacterium]|nr:dienelactone hydrolase family protein [Planctomycetia bacterium]
SIHPGDATRSLTVGGMERSYLVHAPPGYDGKQPTPVVLAFHGGGSNPEQMARFSGLSDKADTAGFLAVYPAGTGRLPAALTFNGGNCCGFAQRQQIDDVAFVAAVLDDLATAAKVDPKRVYATGMSNGGILCYRLASELAPRLAAIAPVSGTMGTETCTPSQPVPVLHFHGADDELVPLAGGRGKRSLTQTNFYSVEHSIQAWVAVNGCNKKPVEEKLPDRSPGDGTHVTRTTYGGGRDGSEVVLYTIAGGGHTWPGRNPKLAFLGRSTTQISANDLMWEFFQKHAR